MRLAQRFAMGLTPAEVTRVEATTEEEIHGLMPDDTFARLAADYRSVVELPGELRAACLTGSASMEPEHLMELGDRRSRRASSDRHGARRCRQDDPP